MKILILAFCLTLSQSIELTPTAPIGIKKRPGYFKRAAQNNDILTANSLLNDQVTNLVKDYVVKDNLVDRNKVNKELPKRVLILNNGKPRKNAATVTTTTSSSSTKKTILKGNNISKQRPEDIIKNNVEEIVKEKVSSLITQNGVKPKITEKIIVKNANINEVKENLQNLDLNDIKGNVKQNVKDYLKNLRSDSFNTMSNTDSVSKVMKELKSDLINDINETNIRKEKVLLKDKFPSKTIDKLDKVITVEKIEKKPGMKVSDVLAMPNFVKNQMNQGDLIFGSNDVAKKAAKIIKQTKSDKIIKTSINGANLPLLNDKLILEEKMENDFPVMTPSLMDLQEDLLANKLQDEFLINKFKLKKPEDLLISDFSRPKLGLSVPSDLHKIKKIKFSPTINEKMVNFPEVTVPDLVPIPDFKNHNVAKKVSKIITETKSDNIVKTAINGPNLPFLKDTVITEEKIQNNIPFMKPSLIDLEEDILANRLQDKMLINKLKKLKKPKDLIISDLSMPKLGLPNDLHKIKVSPTINEKIQISSQSVKEYAAGLKPLSYPNIKKINSLKKIEKLKKIKKPKINLNKEFLGEKLSKYNTPYMKEKIVHLKTLMNDKFPEAKNKIISVKPSGILKNKKIDYHKTVKQIKYENIKHKVPKLKSNLKKFMTRPKPLIISNAETLRLKDQLEKVSKPMHFGFNEKIPKLKNIKLSDIKKEEIVILNKKIPKLKTPAVYYKDNLAEKIHSSKIAQKYEKILDKEFKNMIPTLPEISHPAILTEKIKLKPKIKKPHLPYDTVPNFLPGIHTFPSFPGVPDISVSDDILDLQENIKKNKSRFNLRPPSFFNRKDQLGLDDVLPAQDLIEAEEFLQDAEEEEALENLMAIEEHQRNKMKNDFNKSKKLLNGILNTELDMDSSYTKDNLKNELLLRKQIKDKKRKGFMKGLVEKAQKQRKQIKISGSKIDENQTKKLLKSAIVDQQKDYEGKFLLDKAQEKGKKVVLSSTKKLEQKDTKKVKVSNRLGGLKKQMQTLKEGVQGGQSSLTEKAKEQLSKQSSRVSEGISKGDKIIKQTIAPTINVNEQKKDEKDANGNKKLNKYVITTTRRRKKNGNKNETQQKPTNSKEVILKEEPKKEK